MQNPYEEQQNVLLNRIIGNVEKLNEAMTELIHSLHDVNTHNASIAAVSEMVTSYDRNVQFNLEQQGMEPPL